MEVREGATLAGVRALAFDAYGTLFDVYAVAAQLSETFGDRGSEVSELWRRKQLEYSWLRALMGKYRDFETVTGDALLYAVEALGLTLAESERGQLMEAYLILDAYPEVADALEVLSSQHRLVVLSNGTPRMLTAAAEHANISGYLEALLSADAVKSYKTDGRVYRLATDHFRLAPAQILFCSSNGWDVAGAGAFGFRTCWVNRSGAVAERLGVASDAVVGDLKALADLLVDPSRTAG